MKTYQKIMIGATLAAASIATGAYLAYRQSKNSELIRPTTTDIDYTPTIGDDLEQIASEIEQEFKDKKNKKEIRYEVAEAMFAFINKRDIYALIDIFVEEVSEIGRDKPIRIKDAIQNEPLVKLDCNVYQFQTIEDMVKKAKKFEVLNKAETDKKIREYSGNDSDDNILKLMREQKDYFLVFRLEAPRPCDIDLAGIITKTDDGWKITALYP